MDNLEIPVIPNWDNVPSFSENRIVVPKAKVKQTKLDIRPAYYGLKINEIELEKHNTTCLELIMAFGFQTWVVGRDETLGQKGIPHYHIHFKSDKTLSALQKDKQKIMPNWGRSTKLGPPRKHGDDWFCWAGYAVKEQCIGMSDMSEEDKQQIRLHAHTQATVKKSKLKWAEKQEEKKQEKKDLETRMFEALDKVYLGKTDVQPKDVAIKYCELYFDDVKKMPCPTTLRSEVWKYLISRKFSSFETYVFYNSNFFSCSNV